VCRRRMVAGIHEVIEALPAKARLIDPPGIRRPVPGGSGGLGARDYNRKELRLLIRSIGLNAGSVRTDIHAAEVMAVVDVVVHLYRASIFPIGIRKSRIEPDRICRIGCEQAQQLAAKRALGDAMRG